MSYFDKQGNKQDDSATAEIKVGDVVELKSGSAAMTVDTISKSDDGKELFNTIWHDSQHGMQRGAFLRTSIRKTSNRAW